MEGWIWLHRKLLKWEWYKDSKMVHLFIHMLLSANHENSKWMGIEVKRGQLITGRNSLSRDTGLSPRSVRTCLNKLKTTNEVTIKTTNKYSIVTITKYDDYNPVIKKTTNKTTSQTPASDQQATTNNNDNNVNNKEKEEEKEILRKQKEDEEWRIENDRKNRELLKMGEYEEKEPEQPEGF